MRTDEVKSIFQSDRFVIRLYDYCQSCGLRQTLFTQRFSSADGLPRRDFIKLVGPGAVTLALANPACQHFFVNAGDAGDMNP